MAHLADRRPLPARQFRKLVERLSRRGGGDCCHGCNRPLLDGETTLVGYDARGRGLIVAGCCAGRIALAVGFGIFFAAAGADGASPPRDDPAALERLGKVPPPGQAWRFHRRDRGALRVAACTVAEVEDVVTRGSA
jgi:hypothetical protein